MLSYFNDRSRQRLGQVHPKLEMVMTKSVFRLSQKYPTENWHLEVTEGLRSMERQKQLVAMGASRTMASYHLAQKDGMSHAVDVCAIDDSGTARWEQALYFRIASAVREICIEELIPITWGGIWDRRLTGCAPSLEQENKEYQARWHMQHPNGGHPLFDGPHFQLEVL